MESIGLSYLLIRIPTVAKRIPNPSSPGLDSKKQRYISVSLLFSRARDGAHEVRWTSNKCADRSEAKTEPFEPRIGLEIRKGDIHSDITFSYFKRETGIEPATFSLARRRYTTKPLAHIRQPLADAIDNISHC